MNGGRSVVGSCQLDEHCQMAFELPVVDAASLAAWCTVHLGSPPERELFRAGHLTRVIGTRLAPMPVT